MVCQLPFWSIHLCLGLLQKPPYWFFCSAFAHLQTVLIITSRVIPSVYRWNSVPPPPFFFFAWIPLVPFTVTWPQYALTGSVPSGFSYLSNFISSALPMLSLCSSHTISLLVVEHVSKALAFAGSLVLWTRFLFLGYAVYSRPHFFRQPFKHYLLSESIPASVSPMNSQYYAYYQILKHPVLFYSYCYPRSYWCNLFFFIAFSIHSECAFHDCTGLCWFLSPPHLHG